MQAIANTTRLVRDGVITREQADIIEARARSGMVSLAINSVLVFGILAATLGLIAVLRDPMAVAICGLLAVGLGFSILKKGNELYGMFGNASMLIGAGMLLGGGTIELIKRLEGQAGWFLLAIGGGVVVAAWLLRLNIGMAARFVSGSILLMGLAMHLGGLGLLLDAFHVEGAIMPLFFLYTAVVIGAAGTFLDVRFVTAFAIVPLAQMLDTGGTYFHAAYVFYSPEPFLSSLQMVVLIALGYLVIKNTTERYARHAGVLMVLAFVVANLCALVGSLWGDYVGETVWGPVRKAGIAYKDWSSLQEEFRASALHISENAFAIGWAVVLVGLIFWAAHRSQRGLFNTALTFGAIHAYTQFFESFGDEPIAYVFGGLAAIPLAWYMWRLDRWITRDHVETKPELGNPG